MDGFEKFNREVNKMIAAIHKNLRSAGDPLSDKQSEIVKKRIRGIQREIEKVIAEKNKS